jgi:hypothetical protein
MAMFSFPVQPSSQTFAECIERECEPGWRGAHQKETNPRRSLRLLRIARERRKSEAESENEPDQPHGNLGGGWLAGSLAERHDPHQHGAERRRHPESGDGRQWLHALQRAPVIPEISL